MVLPLYLGIRFPCANATRIVRGSGSVNGGLEAEAPITVNAAQPTISPASVHFPPDRTQAVTMCRTLVTPLLSSPSHAGRY